MKVPNETNKIDLVSKQEILNYMETHKLYDGIKNKKEYYDESTYENTELYDFIKIL